MKTACEEAVEMLEQGIGGLEFAKRLRAEGRELKRLRRMLMLLAAHMEYVPADVGRELARIQKARKK